MTYIKKFIKVIINYFYETYVNKLIALVILAIGMIPVIVDRDATFLAFAAMFAIPLFISNKDLRTWES